MKHIVKYRTRNAHNCVIISNYPPPPLDNLFSVIYNHINCRCKYFVCLWIFSYLHGFKPVRAELYNYTNKTVSPFKTILPMITLKEH